MDGDQRPAIATNPRAGCPPEILAKLVVIEPIHLGFDGKPHSGRLEVHHEAAGDLEDFFAEALRIEFPFERVAPASTLDWDDGQLMAANVTSAFNYRTVAGRTKLSYHAIGAAIDVNPRLNPYCRQVGDDVVVEPPGAVWRPDTVTGALSPDHPLVLFLQSRGWEWGGDWSLAKDGVVDYQHFQKTALAPAALPRVFDADREQGHVVP